MNFDLFLLPLDQPGSRLFYWNLIAAFGFVGLWALTVHQPKKIPALLKKWVFRKKYWWNRSTRRDYFLYLTNTLLKIVLFVPFLDFSFEIASSLSKFLYLQSPNFLNLPSTQVAMASFTLLAFVLDDFLRFVHHLLMHKIPFLWNLHSVHHSAKILTPITLFRNHPLESAIAALRNSLSLGVSTGVFVFLFGAQLSLWTIAGVNALGFLFNFLGANLRHSHIPIRFPAWLEFIFISPLQHQIHHSSAPQHHNRNFGVSLAIWDKMLGSWTASESKLKLSFGLGNRQQSPLLDELIYPGARIGIKIGQEWLLKTKNYVLEFLKSKPAVAFSLSTQEKETL